MPNIAQRPFDRATPNPRTRTSFVQRPAPTRSRCLLTQPDIRRSLLGITLAAWVPSGCLQETTAVTDGESCSPTPIGGGATLTSLCESAPLTSTTQADTTGATGNGATGVSNSEAMGTDAEASESTMTETRADAAETTSTATAEATVATDGSTSEQADALTSAASTGDTEEHQDTGTTRCGNAVLDDDEICDDGINDGRYGGCNPDCRAQGPRCGDGSTDPEGGETCDLGDRNGASTCNAVCQMPGTVLDNVHESFERGTGRTLDMIRVTRWHDRVTAVLSERGAILDDPSTFWVWEVDPDTLETHALRATDTGFPRATGVLGLGDNGLLVAGGELNRRVAYRFDDALHPQWTYTYSIDGDPSNLFFDAAIVGAAAVEGGFVLGARHVRGNTGTGDGESAFVALKSTNFGEREWTAVERFSGTSGYVTQTLHGIGQGRAALLGNIPDGSILRIYDGTGDLNFERAYGFQADRMCPGTAGFFLARSGEPLRGFDVDGAETFELDWPEPETEGWQTGYIMDTFDCVTRSDDAPILAAIERDAGSTNLRRLAVLGFGGAPATVAWKTFIDAPTQCRPVVIALHLDEARHRVWVVARGAYSHVDPYADPARQCVIAATVAI